VALRQAAGATQARVADPAISAWVSANAGTGKTHVLVQRVLRLLLSGAAAESILCLTFTKAAAAQMANRLMRELGRWAAASDAALKAEMADLLGRAASVDELAVARCLFTKVLDAPGGLKIMTIHAYCDRVLRRFPLEAGVPPSFTLLTEEEQSAALRDAVDAVLRKAAAGPNSALGRALALAVAHAAEDGFETLLEAILPKREDLRALLQFCGEHDPFARIDRLLRVCLGVGPAETAATILAEQAALCDGALLSQAVAALNGGSKTDQDMAAELAKARVAAIEGRSKALASAFLTKDGKPRADSRFMTKAVRHAHPALAEELCRARDRFAALEYKRHAAQTAVATLALLRLADAVIQRYDEALAQRSALDFDSLIAKTTDLFLRSDAAAWVLYRLDADLAHCLIDEAQDTSPAQWKLIDALSAEFFSGEHGGEKPRTLFAVGDEKQSIYGFQGAEPKQFAENGRLYARRARSAGAPWHYAPFALSFRSTSAVLESVDRVFADPSAMSALTAAGEAIRHDVHRLGEAGLVEVWPVVKAEKREAASAWQPLDEEAGAAAPCVILAERMAKQIRHWFDSGEVLKSQNRPVRPGDILILVRSRKPFADPMVKALKEHGIPVAGADRMRLTEQLAVMDLMVLGDVLLLPADDLALATLLKTPFFGFDDDDLFAIGHGRPGSLWDALQLKAAERPAYAQAVPRLRQWREAAVARAPYEFYMARLEEDGLRQALLSHLGPDARDAIDEFLNLALLYERSQTPSLQGFLHWLRVFNPEIMRDMDQDRDEVRVMTVHGAKGLEANIVFLADGCSTRSGASGLVYVTPPGAPAAPKLPVWLVNGARRVPPVAEACEALKTAEREENHRLLYVAMTRARDRLYVCGFTGGDKVSAGCWWDLISKGLEDRLTAGKDGLGNAVRRFECPQLVPDKPRLVPRADMWDGTVPKWLRSAVRTEAVPHILNPSRLDTGVAAHRAEQGRARPPTERLLRGRLVHRLLERLPLLPRRDWARAGGRLLNAEGAALPQEARAALLDATIGILNAPDFAEVFGPQSRAEVAVVAEMRGANGDSVMLSGQIDRLIVRKDDVLIIDYKTGSGIPGRPDTAPPAYLAQLAAYRASLRRVFPDKAIRAALLWTDAPQLMEIPDAVLDAAEIVSSSLQGLALRESKA